MDHGLFFLFLMTRAQWFLLYMNHNVYNTDTLSERDSITDNWTRSNIKIGLCFGNGRYHLANLCLDLIRGHTKSGRNFILYSGSKLLIIGQSFRLTDTKESQISTCSADVGGEASLWVHLRHQEKLKNFSFVSKQSWYNLLLKIWSWKL